MPMLKLKIGPYGPELIWHFDTLLAKNTKFSLSGPYVQGPSARI